MPAKYAGWFWFVFIGLIYLLFRYSLSNGHVGAWWDVPVLLGIVFVAQRMGRSDLAMDRARDLGMDSRADGGAIRKARFGDHPPHGPFVKLTEDEQVERDQRHFASENRLRQLRRERLAAGYPDPPGYPEDIKRMP